MLKKTIDATFTHQKFIIEKRISLFQQRLTAADVSYLINHQKMKQIKTLTLNDSYIDLPAFKQLGRGHWQSLVFIQIRECKYFGNDECKQIAKMRAENLQKISFWSNNIGAEGCLALSKANWPKISVIGLSRNKIGDKGCDYLAKTGWDLVQIDLNKNQIGEAGLRHLIKAGWNQIQISLHFNKIGENGTRQLSECYWNNLTNLYLNYNKVGDTGCKWLSQSPWKNLNQLRLYKTNISKTGCRWLGKANWNQLTHFQFSINKILWEGCRYLSYFALQKFNAQEDKIIDEGVFYVMKSNCTITRSQFRKLIITHNITISKIGSSLNKSARERSYKQTFGSDAQQSIIYFASVVLYLSDDYHRLIYFIERMPVNSIKYYKKTIDIKSANELLHTSLV